MPDFIVNGLGEEWLVTPVSDEAKRWIKEALPDFLPKRKGGVVIDQEHIEPVVIHMLKMGLKVGDNGYGH